MDALRMWSNLLFEAAEPPPAAMALYREAADLSTSGRWSDAGPLLQGCLAALERADAPQAAAANHQLAVILQDRGDRDGAVFHCVRGVFLYEQSDDLGGMYAGLRNLVVVHRSRGENRLAMAAQHQAARVREVLVLHGELERVEQGRDRYGEPLALLAVKAARMESEGARGVG